MVNIDGEYGGDAPMVFRNLHKHIEMYANLDKIPDDAYNLPEPGVAKAEENFVKQVKNLPDEDED